MLDMAYIRALEVATFYFMFQLQPVGSVAHVQVCGTTSCMICGAEDLISLCREKIAKAPHDLSEDGRFSWEEVECLGACANAPMVQIGKDYYEDLTTEKFGWILDELAAGRVPTPGPQNGRYAAEPLGGVTSLAEYVEGRAAHNESAALATEYGDTIKRIDGSEMPVTTPWTGDSAASATPESAVGKTVPDAPKPADPAPQLGGADAAPDPGQRPEALDGPRDGKADDLKQIKGIGPKLEDLCHALGFFHFDQVAQWTAAEVAWVDQNLEGFKGRVTRDEWVKQAKILAAGGETEFSKRAKY